VNRQDVGSEKHVAEAEGDKPGIKLVFAGILVSNVSKTNVYMRVE
jgi:hypothetical protein